MDDHEYNQVLDPIQHKDFIISESLCSGYPYLKLQLDDLSIQATTKVYDNLALLIQKSAKENDWANPDLSFFDLHPQFSNGEFVSGILGFHLSLMIYHDPKILKTSPNLYFDTHQNWDFSPVVGRTFYSLASWVRIPNKITNNSTDQSEDDLEDQLSENPYTYLKTCVTLFRGDELSRSSKYIKPSKSKHLQDHYKSEYNLESEEDILKKEMDFFLDENHLNLGRTDSYLDTCQYFFILVFCKQFGFDQKIFAKAISFFNLKPDFSNPKKIISCLNVALSHVDLVRVRVGDIDENALSYDQSLIEEQSLVSDKEQQEEETTQKSPESNEANPNQHLKLTALSKKPCTTSIKPPEIFFRMRSSLDLHHLKLLSDRFWDFHIRTFFGTSLKNEVYNLMRTSMINYLVETITERKIQERNNYEIQFKLIKKMSYEIFLQTYFDFNKSPLGDPQENLNIARKLYEDLIPPPLSDIQEREKSLLNSNAKIEFLEKIKKSNIETLNRVLYESIGKIMASPDFKELHGDKFNGFVYATLINLFVDWYLSSYYKNHRSKTAEFSLILSSIEKDASEFQGSNSDFFQRNPMIKESFIAEIKHFIKLKYDPLAVIDLTKTL